MNRLAAVLQIGLFLQPTTVIHDDNDEPRSVVSQPLVVEEKSLGFRRETVTCLKPTISPCFNPIM